MADSTVDKIIAKENECKAKFSQAQKNTALQREVKLEKSRKTAQDIVDKAQKDALKMLNDAKAENDKSFKKTKQVVEKKCNALSNDADRVRKKAYEAVREILFG